jgi:DNA polymerase-3 subunit delta'
MDAARQVLVVNDVQLAGKAAPALLKTVEEPPPSTVFVLVADATPPSLDTIVSRCVQIPFDPVARDTIVAWLVGRGVDVGLAESVGDASGGRLDRARLLVGDPGFVVRQEQWRSVPARLDGTGAAAAVVAAELLAAADEALAPLRAVHAAELESLAEQAEVMGNKSIPGRRQVEEGHKREERRWRSDDLRFGLAALAEVYRDRLVASVGLGSGPGAGGGGTDQLDVVHSPGAHAQSRRAARHVDAIQSASAALGRNANEALLMDALMVELSDILD